MENKKYQYITLKVETKAEYKEAKKLIKNGWVALNIIGIGWAVQFCKQL